MDDVLTERKRREPAKFVPLTFPQCDCGSGLPADHTDLRHRSLRCCERCYPTRADAFTLNIEEDSRRALYAQKRLPDGRFVSAAYTPRSIEEIAAAHTAHQPSVEKGPIRI